MVMLTHAVRGDIVRAWRLGGDRSGIGGDREVPARAVGGVVGVVRDEETEWIVRENVFWIMRLSGYIYI